MYQQGRQLAQEQQCEQQQSQHLHDHSTAEYVLVAQHSEDGSTSSSSSIQYAMTSILLLMCYVLKALRPGLLLTPAAADPGAAGPPACAPCRAMVAAHHNESSKTPFANKQ
jgi:hypothetical protein